ncbi:MAG TPA: carboxypeptidase-like regulatory domain-containing protein [Flavobacterium sp.]|nr:carboxypeptidase-like regulatory domain-containing protein [Flavobacterium sp.]
MKKLMVLLLITHFTVFGQVSGIVLNTEHQPVNYTNIWVLDGSDGATTDSLGMFTISSALANDTLVFNASGYTILKEKAEQSDTIVLEAYEIPQPELIVYPEKYLHHTIGEPHYENMYFQPGNVPYMYGRFFENNEEVKEVQYVDRVLVYTKSAVADATIKIRLMRMDEYGCPGNDLLTEPIIANVRRGNRKNALKVLKYNVKLPKNGIFVAVEWLITENNQFRPANFVKGEKLFEDFRYQPDVMNNKVEKTSSFRYMHGEWFPNDQFQPRNPNAPREIVDPAIGLILSN